MRVKDSQIKDSLLNRLKRIEGQVRGVQTMINSDRDCHEILQQLTAIRSALQGATITFLQEYAECCLCDMDNQNPEERQTVIQEMVNLIGKVS